MAAGSWDGIELRIESGIATVTIDAPPVNAFTMQRYRDLTAIFELLATDDDLRCAILTGAGEKAFCAGLDIHEFLAQPVDQDDARQAVGMAAFRAVAACPVPLIGALNGVALGAGAVFAALCDTRIASTRATIGLPEINVGRCGGAAWVSRIAPEGVIRRMFFSGQPVDATTALRAGMVEEVVEPSELAGAAAALARVIASKSPWGLRLGKKALNEAEGLPPEEGYLREQHYSTELLKFDDSREALAAVVEKREPVFRGR